MKKRIAGFSLAVLAVIHACSNDPSQTPIPASGGAGNTGAGTGGVAPVAGGGSGGNAGSSAGTVTSGGTLATGGTAGTGETAGAGGADPLPPVAPYDWVGVIGTGQSLSVGVSAGYSSDTQPYQNLKLVDDGPDPKYPFSGGTPDWSVVPLTEPIRVPSTGTGAGYEDGQYPNNIYGETPHSAMANTLSGMWEQRGGESSYVTAHSVVGWSGHCLSDIDKVGGKRAYPASLNEASVFNTFAEQEAKTFGYGGIILTHGECDAGNASYGAGLHTLWSDYNTDLKAITGQQEDVVLLISQQSTIDSGPAGSAVQVWQAGNDHPGQIICVGPKYQYQYAGDLLHFTAPGYARLGAKYAEVFDLVVNQKVDWKPLGPTAASRAGAVITVDFHVPNPPLVWDENIEPPHQVAHTEWAQGRGFEVLGDGTPLTIASTAIVQSSVVITLASAPADGVALVVRYAIVQDGAGFQGGKVEGLRGQLCDSDDFVGEDEETLMVQVTSGSAIVTPVTEGAFKHRTAYDLVSGSGVPEGLVVRSQDSDAQLTLNKVWPGTSGTVDLTFRHNHANYSVHFAMPVE